MTDELIQRLSTELAPIRARRVSTRLALALAVGAVIALAGVLQELGPRADLARPPPMFWIKLAYTGALAVLGALCVERLSRPAGRVDRRAPWLAAPVALLGAIAVWQLLRAPEGARRALLMGSSASVCPGFILAASLPIFVALVWALRGLAPTRARLAGAMAGLTAGAAGAAIYSLHCPEAAAPFVAIWYTLGIFASCAMGALLGPRLLRW